MLTHLSRTRLEQVQLDAPVERWIVPARPGVRIELTESEFRLFGRAASDGIRELILPVGTVDARGPMVNGRPASQEEARELRMFLTLDPRTWVGSPLLVVHEPLDWLAPSPTAETVVALDLSSDVLVGHPLFPSAWALASSDSEQKALLVLSPRGEVLQYAAPEVPSRLYPWMLPELHIVERTYDTR